LNAWGVVMAEITVPIHALKKGDRFLDDTGTVVAAGAKTNRDLPQGYVVVKLKPGGDTQFFGDVQIAVEREGG
jgi:hypothetical protein